MAIDENGSIVIDENGSIELLGDFTGDCCAPLAASTDHAWQQDASECVPDTAYPTAAPTIHPTRAEPTAEEKATHRASCQTKMTLVDVTTFSAVVKTSCEKAFAAECGPTVHASMVNCTEAPQTKKVRRLMVADEEALEINIEITATRPPSTRWRQRSS